MPAREREPGHETTPDAKPKRPAPFFLFRPAPHRNRRHNGEHNWRDARAPEFDQSVAVQKFCVISRRLNFTVTA